jgi:hypothetical protein
MKVRCGVLLPVLHLLCAPAIAQSRKEIITAQGTALDSVTHVMEQQHLAILKATERINQLDGELTASERALERERMRLDSVRAASGLAYGKLLRERDSLFVQHRVVSGRLLRFGSGRAGYTCVMPFSMSALPDTLVLEVAGPDLISAVFTFRIIDWRGEEIYHAPVELLREEEMMAEEALQRCAIEARITAFFRNSRFSYPPIDPQRDTDQANELATGSSYAIDKPTWDALRFDAYTSAFTFPIGSTESRTIAFSRKLNNVVDLTPVQR